MPCDAVPDPAGNVIATRAAAGWVDGYVVAAAVTALIPRGYTALMPHWATCDRPPARSRRKDSAL
jgi:uncharacterized membrane protein YkvA (DUF1232 family)